MEQPDHIDDLLRQRLFDAEVPPPAFVWPNIESALRKRKRRFFIWFFAGLGLLASGLAAMWLMNQVPSTMTAGAFPATQTKTEAPVAANNPDLSGQTQPEADLSTQSVAESQTGKKEISGLKNNETVAPKANPKTVSSKGISTTKSLDNHSFVLPVAKTVSTKANDIAAATSDNASDLSVISFPTQDPLPAPQSLSFADPADLKRAAKIPLAVLSILPPSTVALNASRKAALPGTVPIKKFKHKKNDPKACYDFAHHPTVWLVDAYAGPSFAFKALSTTDPEYKDYVQQRLDTERPSWAFNAGVRATLLFDRHFMLRVGAHYEQITEIFEFEKLNTIVVDIKRTYDAMSGLWTEETLNVSNGTAYFRAYNRFGMLDVPLMAGMELRKGRTGFNINAGVSFNVLFWKRGAIMNTAGVPRYFTPGNVNAIDVYRARTSFSPTVSVQWFYHLQPRLRVFAEPYFRQIVQPVTVQGYPVWQQYGVGGIKLGVTKIID